MKTEVYGRRVSSGAGTKSEQKQLRLRKALLKCTGVFGSGQADRSQNTGQRVRKRLLGVHDR